MNDALFLFLILLLGLLLCSFLGGNCGKEGFTSTTTSNQLGTGTTYTDSNGNSITVISGNGSQNLKLIRNGQTTPVILTTTPPSGTTATANTYYSQSPFNFTATVVSGSNGQSAIKVNLDNGQTITLTQTDSSSDSDSTSSSSTNYDSYNHYSGTGSSTQLQTGATFTSSNGDTVTVIVNSNGTQSLQYVVVNQTPVVFVSTPPSGTTATVNTYYAPSMTATVFTDSNGQIAIKITNLSTGQTTILTQSGSTSISSTQYYGSTGSPYQTGASSTSYTGAYGGSAGAVTGPNGNTAYYAQGPNGNTTTGTNPYYNGTSSTQYYGAYGGSAGAVTGPYGNTAYYAQGPNGNTAAGTSSSNSEYYNSLPPGISSSQIPQGQEDLYILKSQVVPPVCPACPANNSSSSNDPDSAEKCPPCPACARCPEPSFECKKVPNYNAINNSYLPQPVINDFSSFGM
jgi:hypothetical protein